MRGRFLYWLNGKQQQNKLPSSRQVETGPETYLTMAGIDKSSILHIPQRFIETIWSLRSSDAHWPGDRRKHCFPCAKNIGS